MNSCFPPLAALTLKDKRRNSAYLETVGNQNTGKPNVIQDMEMFYIKQIAHNLKDYELEQKMEFEMKMREGTTRLLAACKHQTQSLQAAKSLLTSNERMTAYIAELHKKSREPPQIGWNCGKARVSLSDLRLPLMWRDTDHFKNKGDYRRFAVFCLAKIGTQLFDTSLMFPVDRSMTDVTFNDVLLFENIGPDFKLELEVYAHVLRDDFSIASTPRKIKNTLHSSISRTVGKKLAATLRDELNSSKIGPNFELMGSANLTLEEVDDRVHTHDIKIESTQNRNNQLPLFGHFCCRLAAQPQCISSPVYSGYIRLRSQASSSWATLQAFELSVWSSEEEAKSQPPQNQYKVDRNTVIRALKTNNEIEISNESEKRTVSFVFSVENGEEKGNWLKYLVQHTKEHYKWKKAAENVMEVQLLETSRHSFVKPERQGSLYDETPLFESFDKNNSRPCVMDMFSNGGQVSTTSLNSCSSTGSGSHNLRSNSTSSSSSTVSSSGTQRSRSHWPFSRKT
ncbi:Anillin homology domain,Pleckstrin homology domain,PH domain-like [Cinara cedri]|uniref:Anillin homology domain,Pleckstrin homology domain,PH domain-like n=2 Tax=Cinara cedri TaxID=506608 RepID=A0A5E4MT62_9HEMI|nr:Anillin homology domain,Pleckstrin homology domain,PH domain-like [Cinara cedri]